MKKISMILLSLIPLVCFAENESERPVDVRIGNKFGTEASNYTKGRKAFPAELFLWIKGLVKSNADILDIGCGTGRVTIPLREYVSSNINGFDIDQSMIDEAKKNTKEKGFDITYTQGEVKNLAKTFAEGRFDLITAGSALHWFSTPEDFKAIRSVLNPQGLFIVIGGSGNHKNKNDKFTSIIEKTIGKIITREKTGENDAAKDLEKNGFTIIETKKFIVEDVFTFDEYMANVMSKSSFTELTDAEKSKVRPLIEQEVRGLTKDGQVRMTTTHNIIVSKPN